MLESLEDSIDFELSIKYEILGSISLAVFIFKVGLKITKSIIAKLKNLNVINIFLEKFDIGGIVLLYDIYVIIPKKSTRDIRR